MTMHPILMLFILQKLCVALLLCTASLVFFHAWLRERTACASV
jgi:hypothetical protein